jgi:hypothetical protein
MVGALDLEVGPFVSIEATLMKGALKICFSAAQATSHGMTTLLRIR